MEQLITFPSGKEVVYSWQQPATAVLRQWATHDPVLLTDACIAALQPALFEGYKKIVVPAGEDSKCFETIATITTRLLELGATRDTLLVGIGGGVITDITGFVAAVYMRGIACGMLPASLLGMVDAAIGGKNGINSGAVKNVVGTIAQPKFIAFDVGLLTTLPDEEWSNGFAEVIKYACLFDEPLFAELEAHDTAYYRDHPAAIDSVIERCVAWKTRIVLEDEHETGNRKLLNFGHTLAHAIENIYQLPHGKAVAIGMMVACRFSERFADLDGSVTRRLAGLLKQYDLPCSIPFNTTQIMPLLKNDKKRSKDTISYILLQSIGNPIIKSIRTDIIEQLLNDYASHY